MYLWNYEFGCCLDKYSEKLFILEVTANDLRVEWCQVLYKIILNNS